MSSYKIYYKLNDCEYSLNNKELIEFKKGNTVTVLDEEEEEIDIFLATPLEVGEIYTRRNLELGGYKPSFYKVISIYKNAAVVECIESPSGYSKGEIDFFNAKNGLRWKDNRLTYRLKKKEVLKNEILTCKAVQEKR